MDWRKGERSSNIEVGSAGGRRFGGRGLGLGGLVVMLLLGWAFFGDPMALLDQGDQRDPASASVPAGQTPVDPPQKAFVSAILGSADRTWSDLFAARGRNYAPPTVHLFSGAVDTACGTASAAVGPFYCPGDSKVYLDVTFFDQLQQRFHASGDFARAYVIAHEIGHHVQNQLGVFERVDQARRGGAAMEGGGGLSVRQELQADCLAGVWANRTQQRLQWLQDGDLEEALNAASQIGDDTLQRRTRGQAMPDSFTHGTSAQRVRWFRTGWTSGDMARCDTFAGAL